MKAMTFKTAVRILPWINVPQEKYQIKDMISRKAYQLIKYFRAKIILSKSFLPTMSGKLNVPTFSCQEAEVLVSR